MPRRGWRGLHKFKAKFLKNSVFHELSTQFQRQNQLNGLKYLNSH